MSLSMSPLWLSVDYCDINVTITTQADIESLHATPYEFCFNNVTVANAEGTLTFDNFTQVNGLYVRDSPNLEALSFPDLGRLSALGVYDALALSNISLPEIQSVGLLPFGGGGWSVPPPWPGAEDRSLIGVTINNAPALKTIDFDFLSGFFTLELVGADGLTDFGPTGYDEGILRRINSSDTLSVDGCFNLANVQFARFVQITGRTDCEYLMLNYHSAYNLTLIDTAHSRLDILAPFAVNGTLVADSLQLSPENSSSYDPQPLYFISSIGEDAHLLSGANVDLSLDEVETLGGSLVASNNKNCTFSFDKLSEVKGNISMTYNPDSALPWFPDLRRAANIELRGNINTSHGPNIFPALTTVPGTVTIEAWNSDFNCSQLVKQMQAGIIQNLVCNGTDGTQGDTSGSPSSPAGGAWTILGIAVGIMVLQNTIPVW